MLSMSFLSDGNFLGQQYVSNRTGSSSYIPNFFKCREKTGPELVKVGTCQDAIIDSTFLSLDL